ncbi:MULTISPECIES: DNA replication/repair protein RecF [unclassified Microbulbifer]|uniref:DNA replication/repair protein RecF n=1 Tax=unclassified Microbulbifer TaxID=2619833 RepID=UPI001E373420|nr:DNA replication/repair protein RecF [Microbulbifer sp. YPW16]UHQ54000.1 DNA replication/repair protein RecF [Microbulbifer sp. YPW16]
MTLRRLALTNFRNIPHADLVLGPGVNLFCGMNGSGKTSLLEAVHMLASGRSFRTRQHQSVIREGADQLTVFGQLERGDSLGIERLRAGGGRIRVNQENAGSSSQLAALLPLQVINSESFSALDGGPGVRRRLLDWTVFHVEHSFIEAWKSYQIALRQRNALLRRGKIGSDDIGIWEQRLAVTGDTVDRLRREAFVALEAAFFQFLDDIPDSPVRRVEFSYRRGWRKDADLLEALAASREADLAQGYTRIGPQRADLRFSVAGEPAHQILSRGQQKMLVCALRAAMAEVVMRRGERPVFLVDDLPSELDPENQLQFARWVSRVAGLVLVTGIDPEITSRPWRKLGQPWNTPTMFHVEHGTIRAVPLTADNS